MSNKQRWYHSETAASYSDLLERLSGPEFKDKNKLWIFRGQLAENELRSSLERYCFKSGISKDLTKDIEEVIIREFRRLYKGDDRKDVISDTLYCLSLLRHYGGPTRLVDFSYSKYVGLYFGLKEAFDSLNSDTQVVSFSLWCVDTNELDRSARRLYADIDCFQTAYGARWDINQRSDKSFRELYMEQKYDMVIAENPARIHERLHLQQGVLLCQGNINKEFMHNLKHTFKSEKTKSIKRFDCKLTLPEIDEAFADLKRMNITEESLFPGLDGHARAVKYQMWFYKELAERLAKAREK